jgi:hypothetical protein
MNESQHEKCTMDSSLQHTLTILCIPEEDQAKLLNHHQITDYQSLNAKRNDMMNQSLMNFPLERQAVLAATLFYLDSLNSNDPLSLFNLWDCMLFFATYKRNVEIIVDDDDDDDNDDDEDDEDYDDDDDDDDVVAYQIIDLVDHKMVDLIEEEEEEVVEVEGAEEAEEKDDDNEQDDDDDDEDNDDDDDDVVAYQIIDLVDHEMVDLVDEEEEEAEEKDDDNEQDDGNNSNNVSSDENDIFYMTYQGFDEDDDENSILLFDDDDKDDDANEKANAFEYSSLPSMEFDGRQYNRWKCYYHQNIVVGIKSFASASKVYCVGIVPTSKTVLGIGEDREEFCRMIPSVQLKKQVLTCLSKLGREVVNEENKQLDLPDWIYEPRRDIRSSQSEMSKTFSFILDRTNLNTSNKYLSNNNVIRVRRKELRVLENIPTISGGSCMHLAFQHEGFQSAMSVFEMNTNDNVSNDAIAVAEFKMNNNTDLPIYYGNMDVFTRDLEYSNSDIGRVEVIIYTATMLSVKSGPYCRDRFFNESNRFIDWLRIKKPLIGIFDSDDIDKFWSKVKVQLYLQKICTECIKLGYQIHVMILCCKYIM